MDEALTSVLRTCRAKGWDARTSHQDRESWRYATISVEKHIFSRGVSDFITGQLNITVDGGVEISTSKTSFYSHGINDLQRAVVSDLEKLPWLEPAKKGLPPPGIDRVLMIASRFHAVATQLRRRYGGRASLEIEDEYDVQDLLHALLKLDFDDVRPEEYSPSKGGASSRLDFLLKQQKMVIEAKMASQSLTDKKIGEQLIVDIERYRAHPDCERLVCLVYDPHHHIRNPVGLERDLSRKEATIEVHVVVVPK
ncbi:PD-(D/E)XK nuclease domain-containing protein [Lysobacter tyrosinilyticus]